MTISFLRQQFALERTDSLNNGRKKESEALTVTEERRACFKCGVVGRIVKDCRAPKWKADKYAETRKKQHKKLESDKAESKEKEKATMSEIAVTFAITEKKKKSRARWYIDSGCTHHMTNNKEEIKDIRNVEIGVSGPLTKESSLSNSLGTVSLTCKTDEDDLEVKFENTYNLCNTI